MANSIFEKIRKVNKYGSEYWTARSLAEVLNYSDYRNFEKAVEKARNSCLNSGQKPSNHFVGANDMIKIAAGTDKEATREIDDFHLSRYACYLIAQNGDPRKEEIALTHHLIQN